MKVRIEESGDDEIVVRCKKQTSEIFKLAYEIENLVSHGELLLSIGNKEYYVKKTDILFFETEDGKIIAHTEENMYRSDYKLYELEEKLPTCFIRISKSCIVNVMKISCLNRNITGASKVTFLNTEKEVYCSRSYLKLLKEKIDEMRL